MDVVSRDNAEHYTWGEVCDGWHLLNTPDLSVIQERVPPGAAEVMHYHECAHQFFFVLSGVATLQLQGCDVVLQSHQGYSVPPGTAQRLVNRGVEDVHFIVISSPKSHGDRVHVDGEKDE
ncbi:MAG: cupin domain-containing protein [Gammaproteobacteria bacterium]|nr:cupin domain-containing protein [Gammaproteobacteria bacterium]